MTNVTMQAVDTLHISAVGPHPILANEKFDVPSHVADDLEKRGLAKRVQTAPAAKQEPAAPENKTAIVPANKTAPKAK